MDILELSRDHLCRFSPLLLNVQCLSKTYTLKNPVEAYMVESESSFLQQENILSFFEAPFITCYLLNVFFVCLKQ